MFWQRKPLISEEMRDWIVDHFDWVSTNRPQWHDQARLVLPTKDFFDAPPGGGHETALGVLRNIQDLMGLDLRINLQPLEVLPDDLRHQYGQMSEVAGTYMSDGETRLITYDPTLVRRPLTFLNTLAHEVMHARLEEVAHLLPGGAEMHELATDLHTIIAGFGVIELEGAETAGWAGYMGQPSRAVALAMFLKFHDLGPADALPHLSARPARWLRKAWAEED